MSHVGRIASSILRLILAILLILYGIVGMLERSDEPFGEYQNLADCIAKNLNKRDPEQYCRAIRSKVARARRRKYGKDI